MPSALYPLYIAFGETNTAVILRCERSEPRRMEAGSESVATLRGSALRASHLRVTAELAARFV
jgi:hypothetical protein